jgi:hypothetical protein
MRSRRILYFGQRIALALAGVAITTNALTWFNVALTPVALLCTLFVFPLFLSGLISYLGKTGRPAGGMAWAGARGWVAQGQLVGEEMWDRILAGLPRWQVIAAYGFVAYVFINFFGTFAITAGSRSHPMDPALQVRLITGHAAMFLLVAAGLLRATRRQANDNS